jgi:hypothetical protein
MQHIWVGSYDFCFCFLVIPSCDCLCFTGIYCAWVVEVSEIARLIPNQFIVNAVYILLV